MWIVNNQVRSLVARIETSSNDPEALNKMLYQLVALLKKRCNLPTVKARYELYRNTPSSIERLPQDAQGYTIGFDPLSQEREFVECWQKYGVVVGTGILPKAICRQAINRMHELVLALSSGECDLNNASTWTKIPKDDAGVPIISRGFFEIYHDNVLAAIRQHVRVYLHYVLIWGRADLWTTFDRLGIKLPGHGESSALPLHVDQNPNVHPDFRTVQGVVALDDCPAERGTFVAVPGSRAHFASYASMAKNNGEYVELDLTQTIAATMRASAQACPLRAGSLVSWDSRTTHANSANLSNQTRYVAYVSSGPQRQDDLNALQARSNAFRTGSSANIRDALMHASKRPRYTNHALLSTHRQREQLTALGKLIYGFEHYK